MFKKFLVLGLLLVCACSSVEKTKVKYKDKKLGVSVAFSEGWRKIACNYKNTKAFAYNDKYFCWITVKATQDLELYPVERNFKGFIKDNSKLFKVTGVLGTDEVSNIVNYISSFSLNNKDYMGEAVYGNNNVAEYNIVFFTKRSKYASKREFLSSLQKNITIKDKELSYIFDIKQEMLLKGGKLSADDIENQLRYAKELFDFRDTAPSYISRAIDSLRVLLYKMKINGIETGAQYEEALRLLTISKDALERQYSTENARLKNNIALYRNEEALKNANYLMKLFTDHSDKRYIKAEKTYKKLKKRVKNNDKA